ncbi:retinol dehydrogenase 13-like [Onthophagus taurus]|uniref:retinol dehydrogenase 13-like n=1 Tax=Onthophagus taurus TaxID=166361 RepID=UPI0039BEAFAB
MGLFFAKCTSTARLDGKTVIITGANTGIGKVTALDLFKRGANVIMACRNLEKGETALKDIKNSCKDVDSNLGTLKLAELNLASFKSVRNCAGFLLKCDKIDILINNAGVMCCPYEKTEDGNEMQLQTNHLGHFLFTLLLLPKILESESARIINVSSVAHTRGTIDFNDLNFEKKPYKALKAYQQSKLCNILFTTELSRRLAAKNIFQITTYSLHPGVITTELGRHLDDVYFRGLRWIWRSIMWVFLKSPEQGAQTTIYCAVDEEIAKETGLYYSDCKRKKPAMQARNLDDAKKLWEVSLKMVGLENVNI